MVRSALILLGFVEILASLASPLAAHAQTPDKAQTPGKAQTPDKAQTPAQTRLWLPLVFHVAPAVSVEDAAGPAAAPTARPPSATSPAPGPAPTPETPTPETPTLAVERPWIDARVAEANRIFAPHGLGFTVQAVRPLPIVHALLTDRPARDALAPHFSEGAIHVFVVGLLMDIHEAGRPRQGVHWKVARPGGAPKTRYVIVAAYSGAGVLAHELGHFLGHPQHTETLDNLMSYARSGLGLVRLTAAQGEAMLRHARQQVRSGFVRAAPPPAAPAEGAKPQAPGVAAPSAGPASAPPAP